MPFNRITHMVESPLRDMIVTGALFTVDGTGALTFIGGDSSIVCTAPNPGNGVYPFRYDGSLGTMGFIGIGNTSENLYCRFAQTGNNTFTFTTRTDAGADADIANGQSLNMLISFRKSAL